ncbi:protein Shroom2 isoform X3 [Phyllopteryx taeniolatus]|uniref:protein Shroom2 isoform X3 n=1 Tax=Phyllopteryx taeniolatus TaxID=161469 RepID=UPI002AD28A2C|nr:protein Shroom2 isoform X3 [Phyllopteryx taeniolatus]
MDSEQYKVDPHYIDGGGHWHVTAKAGDSDSRTRDGDGGWRLLEVSLSGGAPWGFTLRGGLEHREPLLITKVEEASKAAAVGLEAGDELVNINEIPLSGFRQEAICLVKGSHRTLSLMVKRNMKMVDIVAHKMPSENDVHVARSFLTKILRSSMRRSEPISRPHSWHSTKFNEGQSESAKTQPSPPSAVVWHTSYDASSSSTDLSSGWEQTNLCRVSDQFSSLGSMDSLEHVPHPYLAGQLSPAKSNNSMEHLGGGGKRDSAYSSFSTSSGTPDFTLSKSNAASTENVLYKVSQWDAAARPINGRIGPSMIEGVKQDDRLTNSQMPGGCDSPQIDDQADSRHCASGRTSYGPVWHVPEKKKTSSPSPPPPPPPARSDSFAATKERGLAVANPEPNSRIPVKPSVEDRSGQNPSPKNDKASFYSHGQFSSNKQHSLSSCDVRQGHPAHHRHHGDKSTFPAQAFPATAPQPLNVGGYFSSMQELPTNGSAQPAGQNLRRNLSTSQAIAPKDPIIDSSGHSRYYCVTTCQPTSGKPDDRKSSDTLNLAQIGNEQNSLSPQVVTKAKYHLSPQQQYSSNGRETNGYGKHHATSALDTVPPKATGDDLRSQRGQSLQHEEAPYTSCPPIRLSEQRRSLPLQHREFKQDTRHHSQASENICPKATPMLHSLSMDAKGETSKGANPAETVESKQMRRNDRFATTLKSEIQMRRAKLQKSKSAATLPDENQDNQSNQSSTPRLADSPFTNTYKDNLKEAQARVLKATSFRRKDLEPVLVEHPSAEAIPSYPSSVMAKKDVTPLPTLSEGGASKSGPLRIGGRKRFAAEKKGRSFSEPDKIHEVGVQEEEEEEEENTSSSQDQQNRKLTDPNPSSSTVRGSPGETETALKGTRSRDGAQSGPTYSLLDQQRLGTFAEYEARWNVQKKPPETRASGLFRSADNILDPGSEERVKPACFHERSRSSPSADFYGQTTHVPAITPEKQNSQMDVQPAGSLNSASSRPEDCKVREKPAECERPPPATGHGFSTTTTAAVDRRAAEPSRSRVTERAEPPPPRCPDDNPDESTLVQSHAPTGEAKKADGKARVGAVARHTPAPASSYRTPAAMEARRSPSPQFSLQRLSDKPPVSLQDRDSNGMENGTEKPSSVVKKVPVRIVRSEGMPEKENAGTFPRADEASVAATGGPDISKLGSLGAGGQDSVFCAFTRQKEPDEPGVTWEEPKTDATPRMSEEQKREELARDIMDKDKSLADILDQSKMKTTMDLMEGLFPQGEQLLEGAHQRRKAPPKPPNAARHAEEREKEDSMAAVAMVTSSAYYSTSAPKAELLIKMKDMQEHNEDYDDSEDELDMDLANKKAFDLVQQELMDSLSKKLQVLREARQSLQEDVLDNNALGDEVEARVQQVCKPNELDKFRMFAGDLDKVVSLLLSLSGRLARVENALNGLDEDAAPEERRTLTEKRKLLIRQHEDAKELKDNLDRRERAVYDILASYLPEDGMADYEHFVKMKSALIIEQRKLEDKIKLGEEQLKCLLDSLPIEQRLDF